MDHYELVPFVELPEANSEVILFKLWWCCSFIFIESLRQFKQKNKMGQFGDSDLVEKAKREEESGKRLGGISVGNRCLVSVVGQPAKKGTVMYKGKL